MIKTPLVTGWCFSKYTYFMLKLEEVTKCWNNFVCSAIGAEYNQWETVDLKPVTEQLIAAIKQYTDEMETENDDRRNTTGINKTECKHD